MRRNSKRWRDRCSNAQYQFQLSGDTVADLGYWGPRLYEEMRKMPELRDVTTDQQNGGLQLSTNYDRPTAARLGITPQLIDQTLYDQFGEALVSTIYGQLNQYYVFMEAAPQFLRTRIPCGPHMLRLRPIFMTTFARSLGRFRLRSETERDLS